MKIIVSRAADVRHLWNDVSITAVDDLATFNNTADLAALQFVYKSKYAHGTVFHSDYESLLDGKCPVEHLMKAVDSSYESVFIEFLSGREYALSSDVYALRKTCSNFYETYDSTSDMYYGDLLQSVDYARGMSGLFCEHISFDVFDFHVREGGGFTAYNANGNAVLYAYKILPVNYIVNREIW